MRFSLLLFFIAIVPYNLPAQNYALFFAVKDYEEWSKLRNPIADAEAIAQELKENYGFETEVVPNPTLSEIYGKLDQYFEKNYPDSAQLFLFFSGHGSFNDRTREGFFIPVDAVKNDSFGSSYIPHARLNRIIDQIPCKHILLNIDACYSGTFDAAIALGKGEKMGRPGSAEEKKRAFIEKTLRYKSRLYIASGGEERTSDGIDHSPFASKMLEGLRSFGGEDAILTFNELLVNMEQAKPTPKSGQFGDHEPGGSFIFVSNFFYGEAMQNDSKSSDYEDWISIHLTGEEEKIADVARKYLLMNGLPSDRMMAYQLSQLILKENDLTSGMDDFLPARQELTIPRYLVADKDRKIYSFKKMEDGKLWLTMNLNTSLRNSHCYDENEENCTNYGRLYTWAAAKEACSRLGAGWRIPNITEWRNLGNSVPEINPLRYEVADLKFVESKHVFHQLTLNSEVGFKAVLGGKLKLPAAFSETKTHGYYWSDTVNDSINFDGIWLSVFDNVKKRLDFKSVDDANLALSCRCVKDL